MPEAIPPLGPRTVSLPVYADLGFFAAQEVPYDCVEADVQFIPVASQNELTDAQDAALNAPALVAKFKPDRMIKRFGWLGDKAVISGNPSAILTGPSVAEDPDVDPKKIIYLQNGDGEYLIKNDAGELTFSKAEADLPKRVPISKVVTIPYRWRRKNTATDKTRQTHLILCYNGPSH
jgi:hypothetical protein